MSTERLKIKNRLFYKLPVTLVSPVSISGGNSDETDHDVIKTEDNRPFITGASVAGAVLNYLENIGIEKNLLTEFFGGTNGTDCSMSRIFISDILFDNAKISVRDGVRLDENKTTVKNAKYDYQIVEDNRNDKKDKEDTNGYLYIEYVIYNKDTITAENAEDLTLHIISGINNGEIRFGFKKQRGLGVLSVSDKYGFKRFDYDRIEPDELLNFFEKKNYDEQTVSELYPKSSNNLTLSLDLVQNGGISIRTYSAKPNAPDFSHITANGKAVIPGSSWNGAIKARAFDILKNSLNADENIVDELKNFWGELGENEFVLSQIEISESVISEPKNRDGGFVNMTRNKINRFDNSTVDRALYSESSFFNGETQLNVTIKNISDNEWVAGLIVLTFADIANGLLAVGGQTSVGRGLFKGEFDINNPEYEKYISALYNKLKGVNENG